jgi:hypothetical protein
MLVTFYLLTIDLLQKLVNQTIRQDLSNDPQLIKKQKAEDYWSGFVVAKDFQQIVNLPEYSSYKIVVLNQVEDQPAWVYTGDTYQYNGNEKIVYIAYIWEKRHYALCSSPQEYTRSYKNSDSYSWCHKCVERYDRHIGCGCDGSRVAKKIKYALAEPCEFCGMQIYDERNKRSCCNTARCGCNYIF